jgi:hypothetical protein
MMMYLLTLYSRPIACLQATFRLLCEYEPLLLGQRTPFKMPCFALKIAKECMQIFKYLRSSGCIVSRLNLEGNWVNFLFLF